MIGRMGKKSLQESTGLQTHLPRSYWFLAKYVLSNHASPVTYFSTISCQNDRQLLVCPILLPFNLSIDAILPDKKRSLDT